MEQTIKLKNVTLLKEFLRNEGYDKIIFWKDGSWDLVSTSYRGETSGEQPLFSIQSAHNYNLTWRQINELVAKIKWRLNKPKEYWHFYE
ncbi:hypothetical protein [Anoxybacillus ayderensis]|uniref:hypothetical protein n=1 Tax=Anoxybacillus ayderensis TaxID=265546 RepID=UPI002E1CD618|nr:hypothetical protein [Anoxybacillus ayderensis]